MPLICRCEPEVLVHADPLRLKQVIVNLVDNAIKYTPAESIGSDDLGEPGITTAGFLDCDATVRGAVRITVTSGDLSAKMEIADQGVGHCFRRLTLCF